MKFKHIVIYEEDEKALMNECMALFLKAHPEMRGMKISRAFMFKKVIEFYRK